MTNSNPLKTIFVVDDSETNLSVAKDALKGDYRVTTMASAAKMFQLLEKRIPDLILLDIEMPEMNGFEALEVLKGNSALAKIPVIFLTSVTDIKVEVRGFEMGVVDFIHKPFSAPVLINRLKTHLSVDELIRKRTAQLEALQNGIVFVLADMVESRDETTGGHITRTSAYLRILMENMVEKGVYAEEFKGLDIELLVASARLHDIGKIAISDVILNKPGKLDDDEFEKMKTHCAVGEHIIDQIAELTEDIEFLSYARTFISYHHERWDGKGYPHGKAGEDIPLLGRIMAIVDVYDALTSVRPYKKAFEFEAAVDIIMQGRGTQFDPQIADVFYAVKECFKGVVV